MLIILHSTLVESGEIGSFRCSSQVLFVSPGLMFSFFFSVSKVCRTLNAFSLFPRRLTCVRGFINKLGRDENVFHTHLRRYLEALRPDCGVVFQETNRSVRSPFLRLLSGN